MLIVKIRNDGTGTKEIGNYDVSVCVNQEEIWHGRVEGHIRELGWSELVERVVTAYRERIVGETVDHHHAFYRPVIFALDYE